MVQKEMMSMEAKGQPGAAPVASSLISLQSVDLYGVFRVYSPPPLEDRMREDPFHSRF
jgi:hypothetical protein